MKKIYAILFFTLLAQGLSNTISACENILRDLEKQRTNVSLQIALANVSVQIALAKDSHDDEKEEQLLEKREQLEYQIGIASRINKGYDTLAAQDKTAKDQMAVLHKIENQEWNKCATQARQQQPAENPLQVQPNDVINAVKQEEKSINPDGRYGGEVCTQLVNAYANLAQFAYTHLDNYPDNRDTLARRLELFERGICQKELWREDRCSIITGEAHDLLKHALRLQPDLTSVNKTTESPEKMYVSVRDLCDKSEYIDWGSKSYILDTLASGLAAECKANAQNDKDLLACNAMHDQLHQLFYKPENKKQ